MHAIDSCVKLSSYAQKVWKNSYIYKLNENILLENKISKRAYI